MANKQIEMRKVKKIFKYKHVEDLGLTYMKFDRVRNMETETIAEFTQRMLSEMDQLSIHLLPH